jgi:hypothetical protein
VVFGMSHPTLGEDVFAAAVPRAGISGSDIGVSALRRGSRRAIQSTSPDLFSECDPGRCYREASAEGVSGADAECCRPRGRHGGYTERWSSTGPAP